MAAAKLLALLIALLLPSLSCAEKPSFEKDPEEKKHKPLYKGKETNIQLLDAKALRSVVIPSTRLWVIEFYADWCGGCKAFKPKFKELAEDLEGVVKFGAINVEGNETLVKQYGVTKLPSLRAFGMGKKRVDYAPQAIQVATNNRGSTRNTRALTGSILEQFPDKLIFDMEEHNYETFMRDETRNARIILFTTKEETPPLIKALAFEYNERANFAVNNVNVNENVAKKYGVESFPTLIAIANPLKETEKVTLYDGQIKPDLVRDWMNEVLPTVESLEATKKAYAEKMEAERLLKAGRQKKAMDDKAADLELKAAEEAKLRSHYVRPLTLEVLRKAQVRGRKSWQNNCAYTAKGFCALVVFPKEPTDDELLELVDTHRKWNAGGGMQDYPYKFSWIDGEDIFEATDVFGIELEKTGNDRDVVIMGTQGVDENRFTVVQLGGGGVKYNKAGQALLQYTFYDDDLW